jgi:hypothetical protein
MKIGSLYKNIREYENLHIALWLIKDTCWVTGWRVAGMIMIIPTLIVAIHIAWRSRQNISDLFHSIAVCLWITANATWMTGEFFYSDSLRPYALIFFSAGLIIVSFYYVIHFPQRQLNEAPEVGDAITQEI